MEDFQNNLKNLIKNFIKSLSQTAKHVGDAQKMSLQKNMKE